MENILFITIPIAIVFGALFWIQIFLTTMHQYRKFDNQLKLRLSIQNATFMTIIIIAIVETALYILFTQFIK